MKTIQFAIIREEKRILTLRAAEAFLRRDAYPNAYSALRNLPDGEELQDIATDIALSCEIADVLRESPDETAENLDAYARELSRIRELIAGV